MEGYIKVNNLTKKFKNNKGITNINLSVKFGEIYGLLGANGAGKTTLLRTMTNLLEKDSGDVIVDGVDIVTNFEKAMSMIGAMIGTPNPYSYLTGLQNLKMVTRYNSNSKYENCEELLKTVGLSDRKNEKVKIYSTGMKQRLAFAMAIASNPKVLLLDEPFNGMDIEGKFEMREMIKELSKKNNMAVIISSHLIHDIEEIASRIGIVDEGCLLVEKQIEEITSQYPSLEAYYLDTMKKRRNS